MASPRRWASQQPPQQQQPTPQQQQQQQQQAYAYAQQQAYAQQPYPNGASFVGVATCMKCVCRLSVASRRTDWATSLFNEADTQQATASLACDDS